MTYIAPASPPSTRPATPTNPRDRIVAAILAAPKPFVFTEAAAKFENTPRGTVSSVLHVMVGARLVTVIRRPAGNGYVYEVARPAPPLAEAIQRCRRYVHRQFVKKRGNSGRRARARTPGRQPLAAPQIPGLKGLREALDKAALYDRLLHYLGYSHAEVVATLNQVRNGTGPKAKTPEQLALEPAGHE